jgi:zinc protease
MALPAIATSPANATSRASETTLDNGMKVVVIPDHRAPVVSHMVWYRVGASDEERGKSGIAHFLEHLMFKGTEKIPSGQFSKIVARNGGQDNAFTSQDATAYHQNIAKDQLPLVMELEADRMANLRLAEPDVLTERDVILEERRSRVDNNPSSIMNEQVMAALYLNHPYGVPIIGWQHEIESLSREDALAFYKRYYAPNNAILIVAGDVESAEVVELARKTYGQIPANPATLRAPRAKEPPPVAPRRITLSDPRAGQATIERHYPAPSYVTAGPREAEAIDLLVKILAGGSTSRLYKSVVVAEKLAANIAGYYSWTGLDSGRISIYAVAQTGVDVDKLEAAIDAEVDAIAKGGVTELELERARRSYLADYVYEADSLGGLARRYGWGLVIGQSIADIEDWPARLRTVTVEDVQAAAARYLQRKASVTGWLLPTSEEGGG